ncbi:MAG TPA: ferrous iron transporter B, partial [Thermopetrobacter sp.]|nr:ferrous iron transporter B [Thermopetrobacter sp.]
KDALLDPLGLSAASGDVKKVAARQGVEAAAIGAMVRRFDGRAGAFAYMLFVLLYFPCVAVFGAITREAGLRWALFAGLWSTSVAWVAAVTFYQAATFAAHPATSALWIGLNIAGMAAMLLFVRHLGRRGVMPVSGQPLKAG